MYSNIVYKEYRPRVLSIDINPYYTTTNEEAADWCHLLPPQDWLINRRDIEKNQANFITGRSCIQGIQILRRIIDDTNSQNIPLFIAFVVFKKAFDSIRINTFS